MISIREAWKSGLLGRKHWPRNLVAGVIVGIVALPLSMAFAIASGVKPEQGIYTAIVGGLLVSLFGGSRVQIAGPTGAFIVILAGVTARYGIDGKMIDFGKQVEVNTRALILELLDFVDDVVDELGCRNELQYVHKILEHGTGADRQLTIYKQKESFIDVVDYITSQTLLGT